MKHLLLNLNRDQIQISVQNEKSKIQFSKRFRGIYELEINSSISMFLIYGLYGNLDLKCENRINHFFNNNLRK